MKADLTFTENGKTTVYLTFNKRIDKDLRAKLIMMSFVEDKEIAGKNICDDLDWDSYNIDSISATDDKKRMKLVITKCNKTEEDLIFDKIFTTVTF